MTTDEHVLFQGEELHFYFTLLKLLTYLSVSQFIWNGRYNVYLHIPIYIVLYQIAFVTVNMFRLAAAAENLQLQMRPQQEWFIFGCVV